MRNKVVLSIAGKTYQDLFESNNPILTWMAKEEVEQEWIEYWKYVDMREELKTTGGLILQKKEKTLYPDDTNLIEWVQKKAATKIASRRRGLED